MSQTLLLLHGAWHGGWSFEPLKRVLKTQNLKIYNPTLYGLGISAGEDSISLLPTPSQARSGTKNTLEVWQRQVLEEVENCPRFHVVGHSHSGLVAQMLVDSVPERISSLTFLDAAIGQPNKSALDLLPPELASKRRQIVEENGNGIWLPLSPEIITEMGVTPNDKMSIEFLEANLSPHPFSSYESPLKISQPTLDTLLKHEIPTLYIASSSPAYLPLKSSRDTYKSWMQLAPKLQLEQVKAGHDAHITHPDVIANLLLQFVKQTS
jgi:pimeloyl-ACP methyl ester carboxylesterase